VATISESAVIDYMALPGRLACPDLGVVVSSAVRPTLTTKAFLELLHLAMATTNNNMYTDTISSLVRSFHTLPRVRFEEGDVQLVKSTHNE
jgi:hypothetical protein